MGATGMVGQRFVSLLENHPWFEVAAVAASGRNAGKRYEDAVTGRWRIETGIPDSVKDMIVKDAGDVKGVSAAVDFVFSAVDMPKEETKAMEEGYAKSETPVVSNNSANRWVPDVPMVIPEINIAHFDVIEYQRRRLGTARGFIAVKPNCSVQCYIPALAAWEEFGPYEMAVATYQAVSGAGKTLGEWPEMEGNIIPYIKGEEEKSETEPLKILGHVEGGVIVNAQEPVITSQCLRVPVLYGHTAAAFIRFREKPTKEELIEKLNGFRGYPQEAGLPGAPEQFIKYMEEDDRPQARLDADREKGYGVTIGRLRRDRVYDFKFIGLAHNTIRGAAGGAVLCAEALAAKGFIRHK